MHGVTPPGRVLIVAGSDSGGGAGIQGDIKTVTCLGGYAATAITALTAQNTLGVQGIEAVTPGFVAQQMRSVLSDIGADVIKTGMLFSAEIIMAVATVLEEYPVMPLVLDPVMVAKGGARLLQDDAVTTLKARLIPRAALITPNLPEAEALTGEVEPQAAGRALLTMGAQAVLVKGGHGEGETITNWLITPGHAQAFTSPRQDTRHSHGTGCALASAIATGLAQGLALEDSIQRAEDFVTRAIATAPGLGTGHGPLGFSGSW